MKKVPFFEISHSVDRLVTGVREEQIVDLVHRLKGTEIRELWSKYQDVYHDYLPDSLDLRCFIADKKSNLTDILSTLFLGMNGFFISEKFKRMLESFELCNAKIVETEIRGISNRATYYFLNLIPCNCINFSKSEFEVKHIFDEAGPYGIALASLEDFRRNMVEIRKSKGQEFTINPTRIVLERSYDFFKYSINGTKLISEKLKEQIESNALTGIEIEPCELEFYISG